MDTRVIVAKIKEFLNSNPEFKISYIEDYAKLHRGYLFRIADGSKSNLTPEQVKRTVKTLSKYGFSIKPE